MLFDLGSGRKKRVVQVIYGMLALLFFVGFVGFGVGGEIGSGGIADIFTGDSGDIEQSQFSEDADELEQQVQEQPRNKELLTQLISLRYSAGNALLTTDEATGLPVVSEDAEQEYEKAANAWDQYLALNPQPVDTGAATFAVKSFTVLAQNAGTDSNEADANWAAAADAQELLVKRRPTIGNYSNLAFYAYAALDFKRGDAASKKAAALAANPGAKKRIEQQLAAYREQAKAYAAQRRRQEQQEDQGNDTGAPDVPENPLGDVTGGNALTPTPTP